MIQAGPIAEMVEPLRAPFPWFGGKSRVANVVWSRFGNVPNYVEPFFGSGAVLLARPHTPKIETINDKDHFVANFWRAVQRDPKAVARHADWPVNETDLHARHYWLITKGAATIKSIEADPTAYDAQVAGWWVWGLCAWIGRGWCSGKGPWQAGTCGLENLDAGNGINRQLPHLGNAGNGINRQLPHLGNGRSAFIERWLALLSDRLRNVRVCAGDWERVVGDSVTHRHGETAIFLDPPYADTAQRTENIYATDSLDVAHAVREWAVAAGENKSMRICLCGYEGEHAMPDTWECVEWKAAGGYGSQSDDGQGRENAQRERLWFSPGCIKPHRDRTFFDLLEVTS